MKTKAKFLSLNVKDFFKGAILAVITSTITLLADLINSGSAIDLEALKKIGIAGLIAFLSYLTKNFLTNSKDEFIKAE